jgi:hypothetical protein
VEHRGQIEQFRIRIHTDPLGVHPGEEEHPPGMPVDERAGRLLEEPGRFGDRRRLGHRQARDDL